jgi:hypothetical protein
MRKSLLASAICFAVAAAPITQAFAAAPPATATGASSAQATALSPAARALISASKRSLNDLQILLLKAKTTEDLQSLSAAAEQIRAQALIYPAGMKLIDERIQELGTQLASEGWWKPIRLMNGEIVVTPAVQLGLLVGGVAAIAAAGGGGGGGGGGSSSTEPPAEGEPTQPPTEGEPTQPPANPDQKPVIPSPLEGEYGFTGGMEWTGIAAAHARGFTGAGSVVAILDTGFYSEHSELQGQFAGFYNAYTESELPQDADDFDGHGTHVAGIVGAKENGYMGIGYAPDATLLGARLGDDAGELNVTPDQIANSFRWARENGADFINNSWGPEITAAEVTKEEVELAVGSMLTEFRTGANADVIYVWANGNSGGDQPHLYAALPQLFPELQGNWVAVANIDTATGELHESSQACGDAANWCISAPGTNISAPSHLADDMYMTATGTSMAAPAVAGALATLKSAFPMLTNEQILQRLFFTANKDGIYANMALYGQGLMDMDAATAPIGPTSLVGASGQSALLASTRLELGSAFGTSNPLAGVTAMALDVQGAGFDVDLGQVVKAEAFEYDIAGASSRLARQAPKELRQGHGMSLTYSFASLDGGAMENMVMGFTDGDGMTTRFGMVSNADVLAGGLNFAGLSQQNVSFAAPYWMSDTDTSAMGFQQGVKMLGGTLNFTAMDSEERNGLAMAYSVAPTDAYTSTMEFGIVSGKDSLFGTESDGALGFGDDTSTRFVGLRGQYTADDLTLFHSAYMGQSEVSTSGLISGIDSVVTSSWSLGGRLDRGNKQFGMIVAQPLRVESADATLTFVNGYANGAYTLGTANVDLAPTGRQINTELYFATSTRAIDDIKFSLMRMDQPGHNAAAKAEHAFLMSLGTRF